jgi:hypothetical protein
MTTNHTIDSKDCNNNYLKSALGTAIYILKCISQGQSKKEIAYNLGNNDQLLNVWIEYLKRIHWLKEDDINGNFLASEDGELWIKKYDDISQQRQEIQQYQEERTELSDESIIGISKYNQIRKTTTTDLQHSTIQAARKNTDNYVEPQNEVINSFQLPWALFIEDILYRTELWNYYYWWIPTSKRIAETCEMMASRLVDNAIAAGRATNEALSANMKVFNSAIQCSTDNSKETARFSS